MPEYCYQAKEGPQKLIEGVIDAPTEAAAIEAISRRGVVPVRIWLNEKGNYGRDDWLENASQR